LLLTTFLARVAEVQRELEVTLR